MKANWIEMTCLLCFSIPIFCMSYIGLVQNVGSDLRIFFDKTKKIVEKVEKLLYNRDKLNGKFEKQWKSACIEYTKMI